MDDRAAGEAAIPPPRLANLAPAQKLVVGLFLAVGIWYLGWRPTTFNPDARAFSWLIYAAEVYGFGCAILYIFMCWRLQARTPPPVPVDATVTVFVPTINESVDLVRRTLLAAQRMRHTGPVEVCLLDDGNRPDMRALAAELGCRYLARTENSHAKAGNLNNALRHTTAAFIAIFDADHAPAPDFLQETLGFFQDPKVAFVQTPQDFYNLDSFQHRHDRAQAIVWSEQTLFFRVIQAGKDRLNSAFFCGSCAVARRAAIEDIGGFATGSVTEDIHTSIRLHKRGWSSVYYGRSLAFGLAPSTLLPFLKQRLRWGQGAMQVWRQEGILTAPGLTLRQRLSYLATMLAYFEGWQRAILFLSPVVVLTTGVMPIVEVNAAFMVRFVPYYLLTFWVFEEVSRGYGRSILTEQYNMLRFAVFITATFGYFLRRLRFVVTPKELGDGDGTARNLWPQYAVVGLNALAVPLGILLFWRGNALPLAALVANILWASATFAIGAMAIAFALRTATFRRREYRFPVPVPIRVTTADGQVMAMATDLSPMGFRMVGLPAGCARVGDTLACRLLVPGAAVPLLAAVRALPAAVPQSTAGAGCEITALAPADRNALELFLFGSDLQWQLNGLAERVLTPLQRLAALFVPVTRPAGTVVSGQSWTPLVYGDLDEDAEVGVGFISAAAAADGQRTVVTLGSAPGSGRLRAAELTADGARQITGGLADEERLETHRTPLYRYRLTA
jgi:cellulose synthase (UDP-forming)